MKLFILLMITLISSRAYSQVQIEPGEIIWEDNFDDLENWIIETGNGSWGWGNGELQYYKEENIDIVEVPGETGNNAVQMQPDSFQ